MEVSKFQEFTSPRTLGPSNGRVNEPVCPRGVQYWSSKWPPFLRVANNFPIFGGESQDESCRKLQASTSSIFLVKFFIACSLANKTWKQRDNAQKKKDNQEIWANFFGRRFFRCLGRVQRKSPKLLVDN